MTTISYARPIDRTVRIEVDGVSIEADWTVPIDARGVVIFAQGSGSSRFSRRNRIVARELYDRKLATLLLDILTPDEEREDALTAALRFDVNFLAGRLIGAARWVKGEAEAAGLPVGYFGTSVGAGTALLAAVYRPDLVDAIVSRSGRPDLAGIAVNKVKTPTLLIVAGADSEVLALNRWAYWRMDCERHLEIIRGATHLFEERGALETATTLRPQSGSTSIWLCGIPPSERTAARLIVELDGIPLALRTAACTIALTDAEYQHHDSVSAATPAPRL